jgi:hypothetical protein
MSLFGHAKLFFPSPAQLMTILNHPQSRGAVKLRSADPHAAPAVDPNYLSEKEDVDAMVEAFRPGKLTDVDVDVLRDVVLFNPRWLDNLIFFDTLWEIF